MTPRVQGATFRYSHTIGRGEEAGPGFKNPVALARGEGDLMYVVSRAYDFRADSKRITICTVGEEYIGEIGNAGRLGEDLLDTGDSAAAGPDHPMRFERDPDSGEPSPYVLIRDRLEALIDRKSFYRLVDLGQHRDGWFGVWSGGEFFGIIPSEDLP